MIDYSFASEKYWSRRYDRCSKDSRFDWYGTPKDLLPNILSYLPSAESQPHILHIGCGNSDLSAYLYERGFRRQTNIDFASNVIEQMKDAHSHMDMEWEAMDATRMDYSEATFDVVIDKGTLDAISTDTGTLSKARDMMSECRRVLKVGGTFIHLTFDPPCDRLRLLGQGMTYLDRGTRLFQRASVAENQRGDQETTSNGVVQCFRYVMRKDEDLQALRYGKALKWAENVDN